MTRKTQPQIAAQPNQQSSPKTTKVVKKTVRSHGTSTLKLVLRSIYWMLFFAIFAVVLFIAFEIGWTFYQNTKQP